VSSISLHKELGVNPRLITICCFACGERKDDSIALLGTKNYKEKCPQCDTWVFGGVKRNDKCPKCGNAKIGWDGWEREELRDTEKIEQNGICQECQGHMKKGIILVSVRDDQVGEKNPYRTGGWVIMKEEALRRLVTQPELADQICRKRMCFLPDEVWDKVGLPRGAGEVENGSRS